MVSSGWQVTLGWHREAGVSEGQDHLVKIRCDSPATWERRLNEVADEYLWCCKLSKERFRDGLYAAVLAANTLEKRLGPVWTAVKQHVPTKCDKQRAAWDGVLRVVGFPDRAA
eukprot:6360301-Amphidinium_carterae.1